MTEFRVGTSGWSYKHWAGIFYPPEVKSPKWLEYYLTQFNAVELNASFYRLPLAKTVEGWAARTPQDFQFCLKLSRLITHMHKFAGVEQATRTFFERFEPLRSRLGPVLIQIPENLHYKPDRMEPFFDYLVQQFQQYRFALEARHESWFSAEALDLLKRYDIAFVIAQSGKFKYYEAVTTDFTYLRFHGPEGLYASDYSNEKLAEYARKCRAWLKEGISIWAFFNNDAAAYAVKNARQLREMVQR